LGSGRRWARETGAEYRSTDNGGRHETIVRRTNARAKLPLRSAERLLGCTEALREAMDLREEFGFVAAEAVEGPFVDGGEGIHFSGSEGIDVFSHGRVWCGMVGGYV